MHIVVTGGSGKLGGVVVERLLASGHQVTNIDQRPDPGSEARFLRIDLTDYGQVAEALTGSMADLAARFGAVIAHRLAPPMIEFSGDALSAGS